MRELTVLVYTIYTAAKKLVLLRKYTKKWSETEF